MITQTTLSLDDVAATVDVLGERFGGLKWPGAEDICYATQNRQDAVKEIVSRGATLLLVIGSPTSSNANRLVEVAQARGAEATLIDGESPLDADLLNGHEIVGPHRGCLDAGGSRAGGPHTLAGRGYDEVEEITVAREDVHFRLPREVYA